MSLTYPAEIMLRPDVPDFLDLPWNYPLIEWPGRCDRLEEMPRGLSRHPVVFVNYQGVIYAIKEMHSGVAQNEYEVLSQAQDYHLPVVTPIGYATTEISDEKHSVLITRYLDNSLPYRMLFMSHGFERYRIHLLDAISGLLVQLHLNGFYWGDCSLSNTLFRRDAGALQAYLVDAETAEMHMDYFSPALRFHDLQIMAENLSAELSEALNSGMLVDMKVPISDAGLYIQQRYQRLWEEITREDTIGAGEHYRIQERIRVLNDLGFSVSNVELAALENGSQLRLRVFVTDRNFHRDQLYNLTGLDVEEMQARMMINEIQELRATQTQSSNRSIPLNVAGYHWLERVYNPIAEQLLPLANENMTVAELYCQVLEHKWYLSEQAHRDVGHQTATEDYLRQFSSD
jgi:tRNA A-37 threonylcarbamoyl transferase component Bud32